MPKDWKAYERRMAEVCSLIFWGVVKPKGGRVDKDCPLCRADDSGSHPSALRTGDVVPNGLWIRMGWIDITDFDYVIEVKYVKDLRFDMLFKGGTKHEFLKHWRQAIFQANEFGEHGIPLLIVNKKNSALNYVVTNALFFGGKAKMPIHRFEFFDNKVLHEILYMFTLDDFIAANVKPPYKSLKEL